MSSHKKTVKKIDELEGQVRKLEAEQEKIENKFKQESCYHKHDCKFWHPMKFPETKK